MKRILIPMLAYGMYVSANAQIEIPKKDNAEVSDKWVIIPVTTMKGVLGRLDINFPPDVERNILIYQPADNKFITSVSYNDKIYSIAPGVYRFVLSTVPVENVPIQKGHETRLKMGFLNVVSEGDWHPFNDTKEKQYTSGNKPKKLPLPVGSYQVKLGGQFYPVIIKDGETVEDYSPVEIKDESSGEEKLKTIDTAKWVITQLSGAKEIQTKINEPGRLDMNFPEGDWDNFYFDKITSWYMNIATGKKSNTGQIFSYGWPFEASIRYNDSLDILIYAENAPTSMILAENPPTSKNKITKNRSYSLAPGLHQVKLNNIHIENLPIESGKTTRIKAGFLQIYSSSQTANSSHSSVTGWKIYNIETTNINYPAYILGYGTGTVVLPVGTYGIKIHGSYPVDRIVIKDRESVELYIQDRMFTIISDEARWSIFDKNESYSQAYFNGGNFDNKSTTKVILPVGNYLLEYYGQGQQNNKKTKEIVVWATPTSLNTVQISGYTQ